MQVKTCTDSVMRASFFDVQYTKSETERGPEYFSNSGHLHGTGYMIFFTDSKYLTKWDDYLSQFPWSNPWLCGPFGYIYNIGLVPHDILWQSDHNGCTCNISLQSETRYRC